MKFESSVDHIARCEVIDACLQEAFDGIREFFDCRNGWLSSCLLILSAHGASRGMRYEVTRAIAAATKLFMRSPMKNLALSNRARHSLKQASRLYHL